MLLVWWVESLPYQAEHALPTSLPACYCLLLPATYYKPACLLLPVPYAGCASRPMQLHVCYCLCPTQGVQAGP